MSGEVMMPSEPRPAPPEWTSVGEMVRVVFMDLYDDSVRKFLIDRPPQMDVLYLNTPAYVENGLSCTVSASIVAGPGCTGETPSELTVSLTIPTLKTEKYVFGIGVSSHVPSEIMKQFATPTDQSFRFALNLRTKRVLIVTLDYDQQVASVTLAFSRNRETTSITLQYDLDLFQGAFEKGMKEDSLVRVMSVFHSSKIDASATSPKLLPNNTGSILNGDRCTPAFKQIYREVVGYGTVFGRCMASTHNNGQCVFSAPIYSYITFNFGTYPGIVSSLTSWATIRTFSRLKVIPQYPISTPCTTIRKSSEQDTADSTSLGTFKLEQKVEKKIAPALNNANQSRKMTYAEEMDANRDTKKELRRRKNRVAAAKSNAKRRMQRLERQSS